MPSEPPCCNMWSGSQTPVSYMMLLRSFFFFFPIWVITSPLTKLFFQTRLKSRHVSVLFFCMLLIGPDLHSALVQLFCFPLSHAAHDDSLMFHGLFFGLSLTENWNPCRKGASTDGVSESDCARAEQITRVVGEVWVFGDGWRVHLARGRVWLRVGYWSSVRWMSNGRLDAPRTPRVKVFFTAFFSLNISRVILIPLGAGGYFKHLCKHLQVCGLVSAFIRFPMIPSVWGNHKPILHTAQPSGTSQTVQSPKKQRRFVRHRLCPKERWVFEWERWVIVTTICGSACSDTPSGQQPDLLSI